MARSVEQGPNPPLQSEHKSIDRIPLFKPARDFTLLEKTANDYYSHLLEKESESHLTQSFLKHTRILYQSVYGIQDVQIDTSQPRFKRISESDDEIPTIVLFEQYFPQTYQYFTFYTPDAHNSRYIDVHQQIVKYLTPNIVRKRLQNIRKTEERIHAPIYGLHPHSIEETSDGNSHFTLQTVSQVSHLSIDRMDRVVGELEQTFVGEGHDLDDAITYQEYHGHRKMMEDRIYNTRLENGRQTCESLHILLTDLNEYRQSGYDIPEVVEYIADDENIEMELSIEYQQLVIRNKSEVLLNILNGEGDESIIIYSADLIRSLLPYLQDLTFVPQRQHMSQK